MRNFGGKQSALQSNVKMVNIPWFISCLQTAFSLKIRPVRISCSAIANHDVII